MLCVSSLLENLLRYMPNMTMQSWIKQCDESWWLLWWVFKEPSHFDTGIEFRPAKQCQITK